MARIGVRTAARLDGAGDRAARRDGPGDAATPRSAASARRRPGAIQSAIAKLGVFGGARLDPGRQAPRPERSRSSSRSTATPSPCREGTTILEACRAARHRHARRSAILENLTPVNVCRVCVVEVEGSRVAGARLLAPGRAEDEGLDRQRARAALAPASSWSSWPRRSISPAPRTTCAAGWSATAPSPRATAPRPARGGGRARRARCPGIITHPERGAAATVAQPVKIDNDLYVRDYARCILCYKCVQACGVEAQNTFAIAVAGRGFDARISTEFATPLPESACVYCGNCIGVCPTGALMFKSEYDLRQAGRWDESKQTRDRHDLPLLRRRLHARAPRPGQRDRPRDLAPRPLRHERPPLHQGPLRLAVRPEPGGGATEELTERRR